MPLEVIEHFCQSHANAKRTLRPSLSWESTPTDSTLEVINKIKPTVSAAYLHRGLLDDAYLFLFVVGVMSLPLVHSFYSVTCTVCRHFSHVNHELSMI